MVHFEEKVHMKMSKLEGDITMQIQTLDHKFERRFDKFERRFDSVDSNLRELRSELLSNLKATTSEINKQHKENETRLLWRLVFSVSLIFVFDISQH